MPRIFNISASGLVLTGILASALANGQASPQNKTAPPAPPPATATATPAAKEPAIDDIVKDYTKLPGIFTFYRQKKGTADSLYIEIPEAMLGHWLLLQATASTGIMNTPTPVFQGQPLNDLPFQFRIVDEGRVQIVTNDFQIMHP